MSENPPNDLISVQYLVALDNSHPSNFTMIQNLVDHLTYDEVDKKTGEIKVKRLSVYAIHLYRILVRIGGEENTTWKNTANLAEIANMSVGQVSKCKKELMQKFHQLEGGSLIEITERKKATIKFGEKLNGTIYHQIYIKNIWGFNRAFFLLKKLLKESDSEGARSPHESAGGADSPHESALEGAHSLSERNNTPCSNTPLFKEQDSTAVADSVCSSNKDNVVDLKTHTFNWLKKHGCNTVKALEIANRYSVEELYKSIAYTELAVERNRKNKKKMENAMSYLIKTLENKWWEAKYANPRNY